MKIDSIAAHLIVEFLGGPSTIKLLHGLNKEFAYIIEEYIGHENYKSLRCMKVHDYNHKIEYSPPGKGYIPGISTLLCKLCIRDRTFINHVYSLMKADRFVMSESEKTTFKTIMLCSDINALKADKEVDTKQIYLYKTFKQCFSRKNMDYKYRAAYNMLVMNIGEEETKKCMEEPDRYLNLKPQHIYTLSNFKKFMPENLNLMTTITNYEMGYISRDVLHFIFDPANKIDIRIDYMTLRFPMFIEKFRAYGIAKYIEQRLEITLDKPLVNNVRDIDLFETYQNYKGATFNKEVIIEHMHELSYDEILNNVHDEFIIWAIDLMVADAKIETAYDK